MRDNVKIIYKYSLLRGVWAFLRSQKVFYTHGLFSELEPVKGQQVINLWHGMPVKSLGLLDKKISVPKFDFIIATSFFYKNIMAKCFGVEENKVLVTGLPRNDILLSDTENPILCEFNEKYNNVFVWLPTYRKSTFGDVRVDGAEGADIFNFPGFDITEFSKLLAEVNGLLIVKPHPMSIHANMNDLCNENVKIINEDWLLDNNTTLYEVLSISSALWTDVSSVLVDYAILDRPIFYIFNDVEQYSKTRGVLLSLKELPGIWIESVDHLETMVSSFDSLKEYSHKGDDIFGKLHSFSDGQSTERLRKIIG